MVLVCHLQRRRLILCQLLRLLVIIWYPVLYQQTTQVFVQRVERIQRRRCLFILVADIIDQDANLIVENTVMREGALTSDDVGYFYI